MKKKKIWIINDYETAKNFLIENEKKRNRYMYTDDDAYYDALIQLALKIYYISICKIIDKYPNFEAKSVLYREVNMKEQIINGKTHVQISIPFTEEIVDVYSEEICNVLYVLHDQKISPKVLCTTTYRMIVSEIKMKDKNLVCVIQTSSLTADLLLRICSNYPNFFDLSDEKMKILQREINSQHFQSSKNYIPKIQTDQVYSEDFFGFLSDKVIDNTVQNEPILNQLDETVLDVRDHINPENLFPDEILFEVNNMEEIKAIKNDIFLYLKDERSDLKKIFQGVLKAGNECNFRNNNEKYVLYINDIEKGAFDYDKAAFIEKIYVIYNPESSFEINNIDKNQFFSEISRGIIKEFDVLFPRQNKILGKRKNEFENINAKVRRGDDLDTQYEEFVEKVIKCDNIEDNIIFQKIERATSRFRDIKDELLEGIFKGDIKFFKREAKMRKCYTTQKMQFGLYKLLINKDQYYVESDMYTGLKVLYNLCHFREYVKNKIDKTEKKKNLTKAFFEKIELLNKYF